MANITLKGVPDELYNELKRRAEAARRSLNGEAIMCLERALAGPPDPRVDPVAFTAYVRETQVKYSIEPMTAEEIRNAIHEGRP